MKKTLFLFVFVFLFAVQSFSQVEVSTRLTRALQNSMESDYIKGFVILTEQVDLKSLDQRLYDENASLQRRAYEVITALKQRASETQAAFIPYLEQKYTSREVFSYKSYWIVNCFLIEAQPSVYYELMNSMDVAAMDIDAEIQWDEPVESIEDAPELVGVEQGVRIINAPLLWQMGITGTGSIVMGDDTGVHYTHEAIDDQWHGNFVPPSQAWIDPYGGSTTPSDCNSHGTHTIGTMCGVGPGGDSIGVAPNAHWIAAKTICGGSSTSNHVTAWQWALDPDGNPATQDDMPDVISNSWWDPDVTGECTSLYVGLVNSMEAAGIAVVFSAGNSGPGSSTITRPKNINTNIVNIWATGAIDGDLYDGGSTNPIASFSSRGPSTCGGTGSLLIKPEGSAPGVDVRSATNSSNTAYSLKSGTSMAAPHIAGAIALLRQFAPTLTGRQLLEALYYTAEDLGTAGEDNTYGMGLIDVYAAMLSLGTPDTTAPEVITDLAVVSRTSNSLVLQWTVPNDTSMNGVTAYDIRMSVNPINDTTAFNNATQLFFTDQPDTIGAVETFEVDSLPFASQYYFSVRSSDLWGNWSDVSNSPDGTTFDPPAISTNPAGILVYMNHGQEIKDTIWINNVSADSSTLEYSVTLENNTFPDNLLQYRVIPVAPKFESENSSMLDGKTKDIVGGGQSIEGSGGPDLFGYEWIDSNDPSGPTYVWDDISTTGTEITNWIPTGTLDPLDEGYAGPLSFGFDFKFYGNVKTDIYISSNGYLTFGPINESTYTNDPIPDADTPNEIICPFWDDLDGRSQGSVYYQAYSDRFVIQFDQWQKYSGSGSLTFQAVLYKNGKIMYYYNNMSGTLTSSSVGIENDAGTDGLQVAYNSSYVANGLAVQISADPEWVVPDHSNGMLYNNNSAALELTFKSEDYPFGLYTMDVTIASNDPQNPTVVVPVTASIDSIIPVELGGFRADVSANQVQLNWETATETNNKGFDIERKLATDKNWTSIGFVDGNGTTTEKSVYTYTDKNLNMGTYSYRLKQIDFDGTASYSPVIEVDVQLPTEYTLYQNYPNPFNPTTTISFTLPEKARVSIDIYNAVGELIQTLVKGQKEAGYYKVEFNASNLPSGTYFYRLTAEGSTGNFVETNKMILLK